MYVAKCTKNYGFELQFKIFPTLKQFEILQTQTAFDSFFMISHTQFWSIDTTSRKIYNGKKVMGPSTTVMLHALGWHFNWSIMLLLYRLPLPTLLMNSNLTKPEQLLEPRVSFKSIKMSSRPLVISILIKIRSSTTCKCLQILLAEASDGSDAFTGVLHRDPGLYWNNTQVIL